MMATQEVKDKKLHAAELAVTAATNRHDKAAKRLAAYQGKLTELQDAVTSAAGTLKLASTHLEWVKSMPVAGSTDDENAEDPGTDNSDGNVDPDRGNPTHVPAPELAPQFA
jgi:hypothetical protein